MNRRLRALTFSNSSSSSTAPLGEGPALKRGQPEKRRTDTFSIPASDAKDHILVFTHAQVDG